MSISRLAAPVFLLAACTFAMSPTLTQAQDPFGGPGEENPFDGPGGDNPFGEGDNPFGFGGSESAPTAEAPAPPAPRPQERDARPAPPKPKTPVYWADGDSERHKAIRYALAQPLNPLGLEFQDAPLSEIVDFLRDEYNIEVQLDIPALDDLAISPDDPINVNMRNITLGSALRLMLKPGELTYVVDNEVLLITSEEQAATMMTVAVYPVGDILSDPNNPRMPQDFDSLIGNILSTVASDTWVENGGPLAEMRPLQPGLLVISQTQAVHEQVQQLLAALRLAKQDDYAVPSPQPPRNEGFGGGYGGDGGYGGGEFGGRGGGGFGGRGGEFGGRTGAGGRAREVEPQERESR
ncbi:DUF4974 domain-containing protein [Aeoliella mucimassa]|uniref:Bacterial type II/III secretion system short domain protein n=1 Tax=Aeoliella mucimassa TaxID=2527972 RepID=A0A518AHM4_9BACT|nr:DUF4974 domain-containing protein [Aeoliella mucimassa]QDU54210.1 hypothetical protein Pan181_03900 [Aeoliella mucimassa]